MKKKKKTKTILAKKKEKIMKDKEQNNSCKNFLKTVPNGVANCRNLPFGERATRGSQVRLLRKENVRSRHQRLFEENVRKN